MNEDFSQIEQRVRRYWYNDGLGELALGGLIFLIGIYLGGHAWLPKSSPSRAVLDGSLVVFLAGGVLATRWLVNVLKTHLIYPRTGYVVYHSDHKNPWRIPLWLGVLAIGLVFLLSPIRERTGLLGWLPVLSGLVLGTVFLVWGSVSKLGRFFVLAVLAIVLGMSLPFSGLLLGYNLALLCGLVGLASIFSGGLTLYRYLRDNPLSVESEHER